MNKQTQRGFTLIELVIVIFMTAIIATIALMNFRQGDQRRRVNLGADGLIATLRLAQTYTLSGTQIPASATHVRGNARCASDNAPISYWVEMSATTNTYQIMGEDRCGAILAVGESTSLTRTSIRFVVNGLELNTGTQVSGNTLSVRFTPPFGNMTSTLTANPLPGNFVTFINAHAEIEYTNGTNPRIIWVDGISGKID